MGQLPGVFAVVQALYPALLAYAIAFNTAPALRAAALPAANAAIAERNERRRLAAALVAAPPEGLKVRAAA